MCGIFAWVGGYGGSPDRELLRLAATGAAARGPHAHGWVSDDGRVHRALGPMNPTQVPVDMTGWILGHARLATFGQPSDLAAVQPIDVAGHQVVHNGNAPTALDRHPHLPSDTAALALIYAAHRRSGADPAGALASTIASAGPRVWALAVMDADGTLVASSDGLPLHLLDTVSGVYLSSGELPGSTLLSVRMCLAVTSTLISEQVSSYA